MISMFQKKELCKSLILIPVSSKSEVGKYWAFKGIYSCICNVIRLVFRFFTNA